MAIAITHAFVILTQISQVSLCLSENVLGPDAAAELATTLVQLQHLHALQLQHCKFSGVDIVRMLSIMHTVTTLTALQLQFNSLVGLVATPKLLQNTSLIDLRLPPAPPLPDPSQQLNRVQIITQHQLALQLIESAAQMCARNRASVAALQTETARLRDVWAFAESIVLEAIDSGAIP